MSPVPCLGLAAGLYFWVLGREYLLRSPQMPLSRLTPVCVVQAGPLQQGTCPSTRTACGVPVGMFSSWKAAEWLPHLLAAFLVVSGELSNTQLQSQPPRGARLELPGSRDPVPSQSRQWWTGRKQATGPRFQAAQVTKIVHVFLAPLKTPHRIFRVWKSCKYRLLTPMPSGKPQQQHECPFWGSSLHSRIGHSLVRSLHKALLLS